MADIPQVIKSRLARKILVHYFKDPAKRLYVRQLAAILDEDPGNLSKEAARLEEEGVLISEAQGNQKHFLLNKRHPLYNELRSILVKTAVLEGRSVYIIAGPNGSGKTTFARMFLPEYVNCPNFVNADLIAQGLAPFEPRVAAIQAGKLVLGQIHEYARRGIDFAFETTLSGKSYANLLAELKSRGYALHLFFLWIPSPELAMARIKDRVAEGGHNVPAEDVRRRFTRGINNFFKLYEPMLDSWMLFDNSKAKPVLIAKKRNGKRETVDSGLFAAIQKSAG